MTAEGGASECGLGTGGTRALCSWDFLSREGKGWLDGPTRTHYLRSGNSIHLGVAKRGPVLRQALKLTEWSGIRVGHGFEVLPVHFNTRGNYSEAFDRSYHIHNISMFTSNICLYYSRNYHVTNSGRPSIPFISKSPSQYLIFCLHPRENSIGKSHGNYECENPGDYFG